MICNSMIKALVPALLFFAQSTLAQGSCSKKDDVTLTFFGLGSAGVFTKFGCKGTSVNQNSLTASTGPDAPRVSSGVGSYEDPALFATAASNTAFTRCEIIYIPFFKKYFQYGDLCAQCESDFSSGLTKVDLWIGPNPSAEMTDSTAKGDASCQIDGGSLPKQAIVQNPPKDLEVQSSALQDGGSCWKSDLSRSFPNNQASCSGGGNGQGKSDPPETPSTGDQVEQPKKEDPAPTTTSTPPPPPTTAPAPIVENKHAVVQDDQPTTLTTKTTITPPAETTTSTTTIKPPKTDNAESTNPTPPTTDSPAQNVTTGKAGDPCPENGWFAGCVWGSGKGQLGDTCKAKTDCWGEWVCVSGKCANNLKFKVRTKMARGFGGHHHHMRREVHGVTH